MTRRGTDHPDQMALDWEHDPVIEATIAQRVMERAEAEAGKWRLRLMAIETTMMGGLVIAAGLALGRPLLETLRAGIIVAVACFASGLLLIGLSVGCGMLISRLRRWRAR